MSDYSDSPENEHYEEWDPEMDEESASEQDVSEHSGTDSGEDDQEALIRSRTSLLLRIGISDVVGVELEHVPFGQLASVKSRMISGGDEYNGSTRVRDFTKLRPKMLGEEADQSAERAPRPTRVSRKDKNQPMEMSSKKPVSRKRQIVEETGFKPRDPRFDPLCGQLRENDFKQKYKFLESYKQSEIAILKEQIRKARNPDEKSRMNSLLTRIMSQEGAKARKEKEQALKREWRKKETERVKEGKKPYHLKRSELKKMELVETYNKLKQAGQEGKIDKLIEKRRQKNANKDHRQMPYARRQK